MRLITLLFAALVAAVPAVGLAQEPSSSTPGSPAASATVSTAKDEFQAGETTESKLPVSLDRIKEQLAHPPAHQLRGLDDRPDFKVEVREHRKLEDLIASLDFKAGPTPAGGIRAAEMQRQQFPSVDNPLRQPYAAFSQSELTTILVENLVGHYLAGRAIDALTSAERAHAEAAAKDEVRQAIADYCAAQSNPRSVSLCVKSVD